MPNTVGILSWNFAGVVISVKNLKQDLPHGVSIQKCIEKIGIKTEGREDPLQPDEPPKGSRTKYRRFETAAEALRYAIEDA